MTSKPYRLSNETADPITAAEALRRLGTGDYDTASGEITVGTATLPALFGCGFAFLIWPSGRLGWVDLQATETIDYRWGDGEHLQRVSLAKETP